MEIFKGKGPFGRKGCCLLDGIAYVRRTAFEGPRERKKHEIDERLREASNSEQNIIFLVDTAEVPNIMVSLGLSVNS